MAQFTMNAEITLKANNAIKAIQNFEKGTKNTKKEFSLLGRTIKLDADRIKKSLQVLGAVSGVFMAGIIAQSPHVRAEFKRLSANVLLLNVAMGEQLAPIIAIVVDALISLINIFLGLSPQMQQWITLTIAITAVTVILIGVISLLAVTSLPVILVILGIATAFAFLIAFAPQIQKFGQGITKFALGVSTSLGQMLDFILFAIVEFTDQFGVLGNVIGAFVALIVGMFIAIPIALVDAVTTAVQIIGDLFDIIGALFQGDFGGVLEGIGNIFIRIVNLIIRTLNNFLIKPINAALKAVDKAAEKFGGDVNFRVPTISEVSSFQEGGEIRQDGLIFAHRKERMLTKSENRAGGFGGGSQGGTTIINNYNTFKIGSVDSKRRIQQIVRDVERASKRSNDRRFKT